MPSSCFASASLVLGQYSPETNEHAAYLPGRYGTHREQVLASQTLLHLVDSLVVSTDPSTKLFKHTFLLFLPVAPLSVL